VCVNTGELSRTAADAHRDLLAATAQGLDRAEGADQAVADEVWARAGELHGDGVATAGKLRAGAADAAIRGLGYC
jgi:hypothetical protein